MLAMIALFITMLTSDPGTVTVDRGIVREGPGTYYPVLIEMGRGSELTILSEEDGWMAIRSGTVMGYISSRAVGKGGSTQPSAGRRSNRNTNPVAERRRISREAASKLGVREADMDALELVTMNPRLYQQFKTETYHRGHRASSYRRSYRLPELKQEMLFYPIQEEGAGWAIAGSLASRGLSTNAPLIEYVNFIGNMVAEASHGYDLGFRFFVLNDDSRESYSTPGGFVFITTGLLKQIESEAELAGILAHEIAHVTLRHGLKELANTRNVVASDAAFRELDGSVERTDEERKLTDSINDELITYRDRMYSMRNQDFEKEADAMALAYMARAGYTPQGLLNVVTRLLNNIPAGSPPYQANELSNRFNALQAEMASPRWRDNLMTNAPRYLDIRSRIR